MGKGVPDRVMKKLRSRLWIKLILSAVFAAACAAFVYVWALELSYRLLDQIYINPAVILKREEQYIKEFISRDIRFPMLTDSVKMLLIW